MRAAAKPHQQVPKRSSNESEYACLVPRNVYVWCECVYMRIRVRGGRDQSPSITLRVSQPPPRIVAHIAKRECISFSFTRTPHLSAMVQMPPTLSSIPARRSRLTIRTEYTTTLVYKRPPICDLIAFFRSHNNHISIARITAHKLKYNRLSAPRHDAA